MAYLGLAALFGFKRNELAKDTHPTEKAVDFLEKTEEVYQQFGLVTTQLIVTVAVQIIDNRTDCLGGVSYQNTMIVLLFVHSLQVITLIATIFWIKDKPQAYRLCICCDGCVVFAFYIYIAIATGVTHGCQPLMRAWLITDCVVYGCLNLSYFGWLIQILSKKADYKESLDALRGTNKEMNIVQSESNLPRS